MRRSLMLVLIAVLSQFAFAGGPAYVAGASYFDPTMKGTPLTWTQGVIHYYTDQGNLSGILPGASADSFVATAFGFWTSIPTAAISATRTGQLAEDVSGSNVSIANGVLSLPADTQPGALTTPIGIVYDADGSVTDALLGSGASNSAYCASNSAYGGIDNFATNAQFQHALIVLNGKCAASSSQLPDLQYHLVRMIGRVLGLDWSQANLNVITGNPSPTPADYAGFPLMHEIDPPSCVPVATCYSNNGAVNPAQPKMDDQAALSRLYPVTAQNIGNFAQKKIFASNTGRIHGNVYFSNLGSTGQPMQGVNVVARLLNSNGTPSRSSVVTSISGFPFCGNAGNVITGYTDASSQNFNRFGSNDGSLKGFFDLAGLQIPSGTSAQYQITVEAVDPLWSEKAGPYGSTSQVKPSGSAQPITVTVSLGGDVQQNILMQGSAVPTEQWYGSSSYASPAHVPASGNWAGTFTEYGDADFFQFSAQANRTLSVIVNAVDESGSPSTGKALPVVGMWALTNPGQSPAPANTPSAFNTIYPAETRLDATILQSGAFRLGIADYRGDGRPDYAYAARIFYGDTLFPSRASVAGGVPLTVQGMGLRSDTTVQVAKVSTPVQASSATQLLVQSPAVADGVYDVQLNDAKGGGVSAMVGVLTVGAGPSDTIKMISGANPATPVGGQAPVPFTVLALAPDGVTPVGGASVQFSSSPSVAFSICSGASSCTILTDQNGQAATSMTVLSANTITLTAKLAPASYSAPQQVQATLLGVESQLDLSLAPASMWIAQNTSMGIPVTARVLSNGSPLAGKTVNYFVQQGAATLSASSAQTNSTGYATVNLQMSANGTSTQVSACVAPNNSPCQTFNAFVVPASSLQLQTVSGTLQISSSGQAFQPVVVRVLDSATPPHAVMGANVLFQSFVGRVPEGQPIIWAGEAGISQPVMPVIVAQSQAAIPSDANGLATFPLSTAGISGGVAIVGSAAVGNASVQFAAQQLGR